MSEELDLSKYEGHNKDLWATLAQECPVSFRNEKNVTLMLAAPLLLAEVRRLREQVKRWEDNEVRKASCCMENEEKLTVLRQSHTRLLAASAEVVSGIVHLGPVGCFLHPSECAL